MLRSLSLIWFLALSFALPTAGQEKKPPITGPANADLAIFDEVMLKFIADNQVPGAALAIAKDGKLVYARGFGHADPQLGLPVEFDTRFRIASISKPITAAMILRLVEMGLLSLDDNPFDVLKIALPADGDARLKKITIRQLLQHTGGWQHGKKFDPMFRSPVIAKALRIDLPVKTSDIVQFMVMQKLDFEPGERYAYCNFGYCLLGRVIEKITGQTYEAAVRKHVFDPIGVKHAQIGQTLTTAKNESRYFAEENRKARAVVGPDLGKPAPLPYGVWCLETMDAHGGWIASAPDLVRFASAFDRPEQCKILKADSIKRMFARPTGSAGHDESEKPRDIYYGLGWQVYRKGDSDKFNAWHAGALDGSSTELVRRQDGLCWAVLMNTRKNAKGQELNEIIIREIHDAVVKVKRWPERNLFDAGDRR